MPNTLKLEIVTPEATVYSQEVEYVILTGVEGQMTVLPQHSRLMTQLVPGEMVVRSGGQDEFLAVGEGLVQITSGSVEVLTDMAVAAANIDEAKAEEARRRAEARLKEKLSAEEAASVNASLARWHKFKSSGVGALDGDGEPISWAHSSLISTAWKNPTQPLVNK